MMRRFIILVDFTETSFKLLSAASQMASGKDIELLVLHQALEPVPAVGESFDISEIKAGLREKSLAQLKQFVSDSISHNKNNVSCMVTTANLSEAVSELRASDVIDFVFAGVRSKNFLSKLFIGNTAIKMSDQTESIIISLTEEKSLSELNSLNIALTPKYPLNMAALQHLLSVVRPLINTIRFFSVVKPGENADAVKAFLTHAASEFSSEESVCDVITGENVKEEIKNYNSEYEGLIVLQKGTRNFRDIFRKYMVDDLLSEGQHPVIVLPEST
jgi:nucleotide-binding universal stress UspA family protein